MSAKELRQVPTCAFIPFDGFLRSHFRGVRIGGFITLAVGLGTYTGLRYGEVEVGGLLAEIFRAWGEPGAFLMALLAGMIALIVFTCTIWVHLAIHYGHFFQLRQGCHGHLGSVEKECQEMHEQVALLKRELHIRELEKEVFIEDIKTIGRKYHHLARISGDVICSLTEAGAFGFVTESVADILQFRSAELSQRTLIELVPPGADHALKSFLQQAARSGNRVLQHEMSLIRKDGKVVEVLLTTTSLGEEKGKGDILGIIRENTREKETMRRLQENVHLILDEGDRPSFLTTTSAMDDILGLQLKDVILETEKAANQISGFAHDLDGRMSDLLQVLATANTRSSELGQSSQKIIDEDQQAILDMEKFITQTEERQKEGRTRVMEALEQVRGLQNLVHIVLEVSEHTTVLALNARVVAARAGEHGYKFTVVANEVKKLAEQTREAAKKIEEGITHAAVTVEAVLSDRIDQAKIKNEEAMLRKSAEQMARLGEHYQNLLSFNEFTMKQMSEWNRQMAERVILLVGGIQFQDIVRQRVEQVIHALDRRKAHAEAIVEKLRNPDQGVALEKLSVEDLFRDYVMESQRLVHERATGGTGGNPKPPPPMVELF